MNDEDLKHDRFLRQRRNLIAVSLILLLGQHYGLPPQTKIPSMGIEFNTPIPVLCLFSIAWLYLIVRYYVYYRQIGSDAFWKSYNEQLNKYMPDVVPRLLETNEQVQGQLKKFDRPFTLKHDHIEWLPAASPERIYRVMGIKVIQQRGSRNPNITRIGNFDIVVPPRTMRPHKVRAFVYVFVNTVFVTEYMLPFVIAGLPPLYWLGSKYIF